jgi:integrase
LHKYIHQRRVGLAALDAAKAGFRASAAWALRWENIDLDAARPYVKIWRAVRAHHEVKTDKSRRTLDCSAWRRPSCEPTSQSFVARVIPYSRERET